MNVVKQAKTIYFIASAILLILGVALLIFKPSMLLLRLLVGSTFVLVGASKIFGYFANDLYKLAFQFDLALGILWTLVGIVFLLQGSLQLPTLTGTAGIFVIAESMFKIQTALDAKKFGMRKWVSILVVAIVVGVTGVLVLLNPCAPGDTRSVVIFMGLAFILNGGQNIWTTAYTVRVKAKKKHAEEKYGNDL